MAARQMIDKNEDNQESANGIKESTLSADTPRPSWPSSTQRPQETSKQIISKSTHPGTDTSTGAHRNAPHLPTSNARSTSTSKYRHNSFTAVVACATADDVNHRNSHHATSRSMAKHDGSHHVASKSKLNNGLSHPSLSCNKPEHGPSHTTSSSNTVIHGFSHPTSSKSELNGQSASRKPAYTSSETRKGRTDPRKRIASITETHTKSRAETRDLATSSHRSDQFCKDCRASTMESVCFIANDGRISAALTGAAHVRHFHHCNVRGCAGYRSYDDPSPVPLSKKAVLPKRQVPRSSRTTTSHTHTSSGRGDRRSVCSSATSSIQGDDWSTNEGKQELEVFHKEDESQLADIDTDSHGNVCIDQTRLDGFPPCRDHPRLLSMHVTAEDEQSYGETSLVETVEARSTPAASCVSSDIHHDDNAKAFVDTDVIAELNDFKSLLYHGDNEYSCSEDGTEATVTPNSSIKGAFDDLSNIDIEQSGCNDKVSTQSRRSMMGRMRQKYLESLQEQEAEMVRLRKQEIMARKQAGDWMLDCHMEEMLHRLAPNGEARVKVIVEAYETVIHHSDSDGSQTHHQEHNLHGQEHVENPHSCASS